MDDDILVMEEIDSEVDSSNVDINVDKFTSDNSTYACMANPREQDLSNLRDLIDQTAPPFTPAVLDDDPHVTLVYSREQHVDIEAITQYLADHTGLPTAVVDSVEYWEGHDKAGCIVLKLRSYDADSLNRAFIAAGAKYSFDDFTAHMTLAYDIGEKTPAIWDWLEYANPVIRTAGLNLVFNSIKISDCK